jgi:AcrR family transcriptional regulator
MQAVVTELAESGYAGTTVERVAQRAGIAKTTVYRRWGGLDGLLADLMAQHAAREIAVPDEGDLDRDLRVLARGVVASLADPAIRAAFGSMLAAAVQDPAAREVLARFLGGRITRMAVIIDRAVERGELQPDTDAAEVLKTLAILIYGRLFFAGEPPCPPMADPVAATVAAAARAGAMRLSQGEGAAG